MALRSSTVTFWIGFSALVILVLGGLAIWFQEGHTPATTPTVSSPPTVVSPQPPAVPTVPKPLATPDSVAARDRVAATPNVRVVSPRPGASGSQPSAETVEQLEQKLDELMGSTLEDEEVTRQVLGLLPKLPEEKQALAAEFLVELTPDERYSTLVPVLTNALSSGQALDVLMVDLLNRPSRLQMPLFLDLARNPLHPRHEEARDYLELYINENHGEDWPAWEAAIQKYLRENPDF